MHPYMHEYVFLKCLLERKTFHVSKDWPTNLLCRQCNDGPTYEDYTRHSNSLWLDKAL